MSEKKQQTEILAGIVLYNPDIMRLKENILCIMPQVSQVLLYDNGSSNIDKIKKLLEEIKNRSSSEVDENKENISKIILFESKENRGVAKALNSMCSWALERNYLWLLTLDQDSVCPNNLIKKMLPYTAMDNVAVIGPDIVYRNNEEYAVHSEEQYEYTEWVITSASLMNLKVWKKIKGFDEWLFIDGIDYDYCIRANEAGFLVIRTYEVELLHDLGKLKCRKLLGRTLYVTNHSPLRCYYMTRNKIYLWKKLKKENPVVAIGKHIIKIVLFEDEKLKKMGSIGRGIIDGMKKSIRRLE